MSNAPSLMQAALLTQFGTPLSLAPIEIPTLRPGQVDAQDGRRGRGSRAWRNALRCR